MNGIPSAENECVTDETRPLEIFAHFDVCSLAIQMIWPILTNLEGVLKHGVIQLAEGDHDQDQDQE